MAMMRFNRWLSSSSFSRRFFEEEALGSSIWVAIVSLSSRAPISSKFLKADFAGLGGSVIEEVSGAASAVTTGAVTAGAVTAGAVAVGAVAVGAVALDAATTDAGAACGCAAGFALSANTTAL